MSSPALSSLKIRSPWAPSDWQHDANMRLAQAVASNAENLDSLSLIYGSDRLPDFAMKISESLPCRLACCNSLKSLT